MRKAADAVWSVPSHLWSVAGDFWNNAIENWGFVSNLTAEAIGVVILVGGITYAFRWLDRRRSWLPRALALGRIEEFGVRVLDLSGGHLGYGFAAQFKDWTAQAASDTLVRFVGDDAKSVEARESIEASDWLNLANVLLDEFDRLDRRLATYAWILRECPKLYRHYALLDGQMDSVRANVEVLNTPEKHAPALVRVMRRKLPEEVTAVMSVSTVCMAEANRLNPGTLDAGLALTRSASAYSEHMEKLLREQASNVQRDEG